MRANIRSTVRPVAVAVGVLLTTVAVWVASTLSLAVALAATALIVPGTGTPNANIVAGYRENARDYYITPFNPGCHAGDAGTGANACNLVGINYPAQFWPIPLPGWGGLTGAKWDVSTGKGLNRLNSTLINTLAADPTEQVTIFGYSQGGNVVSREKRLLANLDPTVKQQLSFVMIGNANRPNGGLFERLAFLGTVPILDATFGLPAPTNTGIATTDIAFQYDGVADFPLYPLNLLATLNAIAGFAYVHGTYLAQNAKSDPGELPDDYTPEQLADQLDETKNPANFTRYGDTTYVTIPTRILPIVRPFLDVAKAIGLTFIVKPIVDLLSPVLRVLIDTGYDRTLPFGVPAPFRLVPLINPVPVIADVIRAVGQGVDAFAADIFGRRTTLAPVGSTPAVASVARSIALAPTPLTGSATHGSPATSTEATTVTGPVTTEATPQTPVTQHVTNTDDVTPETEPVVEVATTEKDAPEKPAQETPETPKADVTDTDTDPGTSKDTDTPDNVVAHKKHDADTAPSDGSEKQEKPKADTESGDNSADHDKAAA